MSGHISKFALLIFFLSIPVFASAAVSQLSFTTEPQTIKSGDISGTITVQLQDASGVLSNSTETMDVVFSSTSATGEFLSPSSENPVTKTISTGSANKNFRYRDSASGTFTLTVTATGRVSGAIVTAHQTILVSNSSSAGTSPEPPPTPISTPVGDRTGGPVITHVYYSSEPLSNMASEKTVTLSAGRDRLGTVGSPLEFKAMTNIPYLKNTTLKWNFGDGSEAIGETVLHTYDYPGEYVVMLNSSSQEGLAVARTNVKILSPEIAVVAADPEHIELKNNSPGEISLFGRALFAGGKVFAFPQDTIMKAGQIISFPARITTLHPRHAAEVVLLVLGDTEQAKIDERVDEEKSKRITHLTNQLVLLQSELVRMSRQNTLSIPPPRPTVASISPVETSTASVSFPASDSQRATVAGSGWFDKVKKFFLPSK